MMKHYRVALFSGLSGCAIVLALLAGGCAAKPTVYAENDPVFQEVAAMQSSGCSLRHGEQAVILSERIDAVIETPDAIDITLHRSILFGKGAMGGIPQLSFSYHPGRGEKVSITGASARVPQGPNIAPVFAGDIPPTPSKAMSDPDLRKVTVQFVMPQGGVVDVTVTKHIPRLPMLPGVSAVMISGLPLRRCSVSATVVYPKDLTVHVRQAFSPKAAVAETGKDRDETLAEKSWLAENLAPSVHQQELLEISTVPSWRSLGQALKEGFIARMDLSAETLRIGHRGMTPQEVVEKVQSMVSTCPRSSGANDDFMLPMSLDTVANWGCGACRDLSALVALGLRQSGFIPNLVFVKPQQGLEEDFPTDNLPHVIVSVFYKLKMLYFDPTIPGSAGALHFSVAGSLGLVVPLVPHPDVVPTLMRIPSNVPKTVNTVSAADPETWKMTLEDTAGVNEGHVYIRRTFTAVATTDTEGYRRFDLTYALPQASMTIESLMLADDVAVPSAFIIASGEGPGGALPNRAKHIIIAPKHRLAKLHGTYTLTFASDIWGEIPTPSKGIVSGWTRNLSPEAGALIGLITSTRFGAQTSGLPKMPAKTDVLVPGNAWRPEGMVWAKRAPVAERQPWWHVMMALNEVRTSAEKNTGPLLPPLTMGIAWGLPTEASANTVDDILSYGSPWGEMARQSVSDSQTRLGLMIPCTDAMCLHHGSYLEGMPVLIRQDEVGSDILQPFLTCSPLDILDGTPAVILAEQKGGGDAIEKIELVSQAMDSSNISIQARIVFNARGEASVWFGLAASGSARCFIASCRNESQFPPPWVLMKTRGETLLAKWNIADAAERFNGGFAYDLTLPFSECPYIFSNNAIQVTVKAQIPETCFFRSKSYRKSSSIGDGREEITLHTTKSNATFHQTRYWGEIRPQRAIRDMGLTLEYECTAP